MGEGRCAGTLKVLKVVAMVLTTMTMPSRGASRETGADVDDVFVEGVIF